jgi:hypothetical protein
LCNAGAPAYPLGLTGMTTDGFTARTLKR